MRRRGRGRAKGEAGRDREGRTCMEGCTRDDFIPIMIAEIGCGGDESASIVSVWLTRSVSPTNPRPPVQPTITLHHVPLACRLRLPPPFIRPSLVTHSLLAPQISISSPSPNNDLLCRLGTPTGNRLLLIRHHPLCFRSSRPGLPATLGLRSGSLLARKRRSCRTRRRNKGLAQHRWLDRKQASPILPYTSHPSPHLPGTFQTRSRPHRAGNSLPTTSSRPTSGTISTASTSIGSTQVK